MENTLPKRFAQTVRSVLFAFFAIFVFTLPVIAQDKPAAPEDKPAPPIEDKTAAYQQHIANGTQYLEEGKHREAIAEFNRALLLNPASEEAKKSIILANQKIAARSATPDTASIEKDRLNFHLTKGTEYFDTEKYDLAIAEWEQALQIDPENKLAQSLIESAKRAKVDLLIEKGHDAFFAGNFEEAISIWEQAQVIAPRSQALADLLAEAREVRHKKNIDRTGADLKQQSQRMREFIDERSLLPEGMGTDGMEKEDISQRPAPAEHKQFGAREAIMKELSQPVAFEFECESLRGVLKFLTEITGINILIDEDVFEQFGKEDDCFGNEVDRKEIFVTIHVSELPLESALNGMLRQHGLGFSIERDFIYVSTPDVLRGSSFEQLETRFYHLKDTSRLSLPKLDTTGSSAAPTLGGTALALATGTSLLSRTKTVSGESLQELDPDFHEMSVPKLVNILRTFVPIVVDQTKSTTKRTATVAEDREFGGIQKQTDQIQLFDSPRKMWSDSTGREILSLIDFDPHTNTLIVRNTPTNLDMVEVFLDQLDNEPKQISVEAKFITYNLADAKRAGVDFTFGGEQAVGTGGDQDSSTAQFRADGGNVNLRLDTDIADEITGSFTGGADILFRFTKADGDFLRSTINLLEDLQDTRVVSAPRLVTLNNKPAVIQDSTTRSFLSDVTIDTTTIVGATAETTTSSQSVDPEFTDVTEGISLSITPQIQADNTIRLFILPSVSQIGAVDQFLIQSSSQNVITVNTVTRPQIIQQSLFTNVVINDGDTVVVGGLIRDKAGFQNKSIPFFKDIPLVGRLFENDAMFSEKQNLLIFISVNIMDARGVSYTRLK
jgi:type II secretory pathway component GspD/PulD (secretin)